MNLIFKLERRKTYKLFCLSTMHDFMVPTKNYWIIAILKFLFPPKTTSSPQHLESGIIANIGARRIICLRIIGKKLQFNLLCGPTYCDEIDKPNLRRDERRNCIQLLVKHW